MTAVAIRNSLVALALVSAPLLAAPQIDPAKEADIRRLIELTGAAKTAQSVVAEMTKQMRPMLERTLPDHPQRAEIIDTFLQRLPERFRAEDLIERIVPIYDKHLTQEDIKGLIEFYQTPLGQRMIRVLPLIVQESQVAGRELGQELGKEVMMEVVRDIEKREKKP